MRIKVKSLQGDECNLEVEADQLVATIKQTVSEQINVPVERLKLVYKGRTLLDSSSIKEYNLEDDCKLHLLILKVTPTISSTPASASQTQQTGAEKLEDQPQATTSKLDDTRDTDSNKSNFQRLIEVKLSAHFDPDAVKKIMKALNDEIKNDVNCSSLDDLERLAKQKLNIE